MDCNKTCPHSGDISSLKTSDKFIMEKINGIETKVDNNHTETKALISGLSKQISQLDKKFAPKRVESAIKWAVGVIVGGIIVAGLNSLIK